jgi:hypothetical protein
LFLVDELVPLLVVTRPPLEIYLLYSASSSSSEYPACWTVLD